MNKNLHSQQSATLLDTADLATKLIEPPLVLLNRLLLYPKFNIHRTPSQTAFPILIAELISLEEPPPASDNTDPVLILADCPNFIITGPDTTFIPVVNGLKLHQMVIRINNQILK